ncbi:MAG: hypothetical protein WCK89_17865, partial [bacterium]
IEECPEELPQVIKKLDAWLAEFRAKAIEVTGDGLTKLNTMARLFIDELADLSDELHAVKAFLNHHPGIALIGVPGISTITLYEEHADANRKRR